MHTSPSHWTTVNSLHDFHLEYSAVAVVIKGLAIGTRTQFGLAVIVLSYLSNAPNLLFFSSVMPAVTLLNGLRTWQCSQLHIHTYCMPCMPFECG